MTEDVDVTRRSEEELENIVRVHQPTSHLRTRAMDELDRRYKLSESKKTSTILGITKSLLWIAIITAIATIIALFK